MGLPLAGKRIGRWVLRIPIAINKMKEEKTHYKNRSFRLDELTYKKLRKLRHKVRISYNLLLLDMYRQYNPDERKRDNYQPYRQNSRTDNRFDVTNKK